jgi:hypothetical protein
MARFKQPASEQEVAWKRWVAAQPEAVRKVAERFDPWTLYRLKTTNHRVSVVSFNAGTESEVTLTVAVTGDFNLVDFERQAVGIKPADLEECALPGPHEKVGSLLTHQEVKENIDVVRVMFRPDLWEMGPDGKARRKEN